MSDSKDPAGDPIPKGMSEITHILTVEDDEAIRSLIKYALLQYGYEVTEAGTGQEAIEAVHAADYDLVILDLMLGGDISGWDVFEEMKKKGIREQTKVMIMTARSQEAEILKGWRVGVDQYCTKPFDLDMFVVTVQDTLLSTKEQLARQRDSELRKTELLHMVDTVFEE